MKTDPVVKPSQFLVHFQGATHGPFDLAFIEAMVMAGVYPPDVNVQVSGETQITPLNKRDIGEERPRRPNQVEVVPIQSQDSNPTAASPKPLSTEAKFAWAVSIAGVIVLFSIFVEVSSSKSAPTSSNPVPSTPISIAPRPSTTTKPIAMAQPSRPAFDAPELSLPRSGEVRRYTNEDGVAPLQIQSSVGDHYLVKLEDAASGKAVLAVFVRGGQTEEIEVPLGTYTVKYASGEKWFGSTHLFGPDTQYSKADQTFTFSSNGYQYTGYTLTLYKVRDGNLRTSKLQPTEF